MNKKLKDMTFDDLVNEAALEIHTELLAGKFKIAVSRMLNLAIQWHEIKLDKKK